MRFIPSLPAVVLGAVMLHSDSVNWECQVEWVLGNDDASTVLPLGGGGRREEQENGIFSGGQEACPDRWGTRTGGLDFSGGQEA